MVREAQKAGLEFDEDKLLALNCWYEEPEFDDEKDFQPNIPPIVVVPGSPPLDSDGNGPRLEPRANNMRGTNNTNGAHGAEDKNRSEKGLVVDANSVNSYHCQPLDTRFHQKLYNAETKGRMHDVLQLNNGASAMGVFSWNMMEYMPFRRMDLCEDGSWKAITWPLPKGETRDMPANAIIHGSAIRRMIADESYRPGNLIVGGGGRGMRHAPAEMGIGRWVATREEGHAVGECFVRLEPPKRTKTADMASSNGVSGGP
jgi:hypothetical protein